MREGGSKNAGVRAATEEKLSLRRFRKRLATCMSKRVKDGRSNFVQRLACDFGIDRDRFESPLGCCDSKRFALCLERFDRSGNGTMNLVETGLAGIRILALLVAVYGVFVDRKETR